MDHLGSGALGFVVLYHIANFVAFASFLLRDQLKLRIVMAVSLVLQGLYYYAIPGGPLLDPLFWKIVTVAANLLMIGLVFRDRLDYGIAAELKPLFRRIAVLTPGQFRRLIAVAERRAPLGHPILVRGKKPEMLFYLVDGTAHVTKDGATISETAGLFLGEIAFLTGSSATATVTLEEGSICLAWPVNALRALMAKDAAIDIALRGLFNHDLARKVSNSALPRGEHWSVAS
jgi:hypothetical protein